MKIVIGSFTYDSDKEPIGIILSDSEREKVVDGEGEIVSFTPPAMSPGEVKAWLDKIRTIIDVS